MKNTIIYHKDSTINISASGIRETSTSLIPNFYHIEVQTSMFGNKVTIKEKEVIIPTSALPFARQYMDFTYLNKLFSDESRRDHKDLNIPVKVGYLFHGKQGSGKTTIIQAAAQLLINQMDARVFIVDDFNGFRAAREIIKTIRENEDFLAVILWDECEDYMENHERALKPMLDGIESITNCVIMCSTNYIKTVPDTIKDRPSRFKYVLQIDNIEAEEIIFPILSNMNKALTVPLDDKLIRNLTPKCKGMTIDEIKNKFIEACFARLDLKPVLPTVEEEEEPRRRRGNGGLMDFLSA